MPFTRRLKYVHTVDCNTQYFVNWQQNQGNQLLHFCGDNSVLCCWQWHAAQYNKQNSLLCCQSSTLNIYYITDSDIRGSTMQIKLTVAFTLQKWLCQHTKVLHIIYTAYLVIYHAQQFRISGPVASVQKEVLYINSEWFWWWHSTLNTAGFQGFAHCLVQSECNVSQSLDNTSQST